MLANLDPSYIQSHFGHSQSEPWHILVPTGSAALIDTIKICLVAQYLDLGRRVYASRFSATSVGIWHVKSSNAIVA